MKFQLGFASLILAIAAPLAAFAQPAGKVGNVTFALVHTTYSEDYKETEKTNLYKETYAYKNVVTKYGNKEFIADLITKGVLTGAVADWSLKYVDIEDGDFSGLFALNKNGSAVYLNSSVFGRDWIGGYAFSGTYDYVTTYKNEVAQTYTESQSWKETDKVEIYLSPLAGVDLILTAFHNYGYTYKKVYNEVTETTVSETYTSPAQNFSSVVGHDDEDSEGGLVSGSINISALKDGDISAYLSAIQ